MIKIYPKKLDTVEMEIHSGVTMPIDKNWIVCAHQMFVKSNCFYE
jgi:hypothetical protein